MTVSQEFDTSFPGLPDFPNYIPTAPLLRLELQKLIKNDASETSRLWHACTNEGFFYLDLRDNLAQHGVGDSKTGLNGHKTSPETNSSGTTNEQNNDALDGESFLRNSNKLFPVGEQFFDLPVAEKVTYDLKDAGSYFGYKGIGAGFVDGKGTKDRNEFYNVSKDDIMGLSERVPAPPMVEPHRPLLRSYIKNAHAIVSLILTRLGNSLHLEPRNGSADGLLPSLHRLDARSGDQVRFVRAPPQPLDDRQTALGAHTDFGSVTLLFNRLGGLQVMPQPGLKLPTGEPCRDWLYVRPLPGHCIVNLGDAMVKLSAGVLRSATHRVVSPPGEQGRHVRHSLVYFARPEDTVILKALRGHGSEVVDEAARAMESRGEEEEGISAKDWTLGRALRRRGVGDWKGGEGTEVRHATT